MDGAIEATPTEPFQRPVGPNERLYLAYRAVIPPVCLHFIVDGVGDLDGRTLQQAVSNAALVNPGCRLRLRGYGKRSRWVAQPEPPPVIVCDEPLDPEKLDECALLQENIQPRSDNTCAVYLFPGSRIVFRALHGVMDGRGALAWIQEVFRALRGEALLGHMGAEIDSEIASRNGPRVVRARLTHDAPCALSPRGAEVRTHTTVRRRIDGVPRVTVPAIAEALASLHRDLGETRPLRLMVSVDLRPRAPDVASTSNLTLPIFLEVPADATQEEVSHQMLASLAGRSELKQDPTEYWFARLPLAMIAAMGRATCWLGSRRGSYLGTAVVSHLGAVSLGAYSSPNFRATSVWGLPVAGGFMPLAVTLLEHPNHVEFCCSVPAHPESRNHLAEFLDRVESRARSSAQPAQSAKVSARVPAMGVPAGAERAALMSEIKGMLAEISREPELSELEAGVNLFEVGAVDSMGFVRLVASLEAKYETQASEEDYGESAFFTLDGLVDWLTTERVAAAPP